MAEEIVPPCDCEVEAFHSTVLHCDFEVEEFRGTFDLCGICLQDLEEPEAEKSIVLGCQINGEREMLDAEVDCELLFVLRSGEFRRIFALERPLGVVFKDGCEEPVVAQVEPLSHAESLGIRPGWLLRSAGGESVGACDDVLVVVERAMRGLPEKMDHVVSCPTCRCRLHRECLKHWLSIGNHTCPMCRGRIGRLSGRVARDPAERRRHRRGLWTVTSSDRWSTDLMDTGPASWLTACFCPCIIAGRNWHGAGLGSSLHACLPVGILAFVLLCFTIASIAARPARCRFPNMATDWQMFATHVHGDCTALESVCFVGRNITWVAFVFSLFVVRKRLAVHYGIRETLAMFCCHYCGCYAWTLCQEQRHVDGVDMATVATSVARLKSVLRCLFRLPAETPVIPFQERPILREIP